MRVISPFVHAYRVGVTALQSAVIWFFALAISGVVVTVFGIHTVFGLGWACIGFGAFLFAGAWFLKMGITANG